MRCLPRSTTPARELRVAGLPSAIDLSTSALTFLAGRLATHRVAVGSRWRKLPPARQALLVLAHLRCGDTYARPAAGPRGQRLRLRSPLSG
jgi:hypothetical protein